MLVTVRPEIGQAKRDELQHCDSNTHLPLDHLCLILAPLLFGGIHQESDSNLSRFLVLSAVCLLVHRALGLCSPIHNNTTPRQPPASIEHFSAVIGAHAGVVSLLLMPS